MQGDSTVISQLNGLLAYDTTDYPIHAIDTVSDQKPPISDQAELTWERISSLPGKALLTWTGFHDETEIIGYRYFDSRKQSDIKFTRATSALISSIDVSKSLSIVDMSDAGSRGVSTNAVSARLSFSSRILLIMPGIS